MSTDRFHAAWDAFVTGGTPERASDDTARLVRFLNVFLLVGILTLSGFALLNILAEHRPILGAAEIALSLFAGATLLYLRASRAPDRVATISLLLIATIFVLLIVTGGVQRTGIYWVPIFPIAAFFLKGRYHGIFWILGFICSLLVLHLVSLMTTLSLSYGPVELRQLLASLTILGTLVYFYFEYVREHDEHILVEREHELYERNRELREQIASQEESQVRQRELIATIDKTITEIQQKNADLEHNKTAMLNILEDLEREKETTLENERKDEALLASIGESMVATDAKGTVIVANKRAEELVGVPAKRLVGKPYAEILRFVDTVDKPLAAKAQPIAIALATREPYATSDLKVVRADGTHVPVAVTAAPVESKGKQIGGIVVLRDITREKQIDQAKTEFVSLASHQLRTPLSAIGWYVEMLLSGDAGKLDETQTEYLKEIQHGGKRLVDMVNSLLNVSRIELGTFMVEPKPTKPVELAEAVLDEVKALITNHNLTLERRFAKDIPVITLDPHLLQIILQNLISNAIKYTPEGGKITLSLGVKDDAFAIKIKDTGIGIPASQHEHIFEKLFRADNVKKTDTDGTGLGLYMVKQILDEIGGTISFASAEGKGTTFLVFLPLRGMKQRAGTRRLS